MTSHVVQTARAPISNDWKAFVVVIRHDHHNGGQCPHESHNASRVGRHGQQCGSIGGMRSQILAVP